MMLVLLTVAPRGFANFPKKPNSLIEVFPFRGLLIVWVSIVLESVDRCLRCGKVNGAYEGSDPMKPLAGASEWVGPHRKSGKPQKIFVEVFPSGGSLSIWRGAHVDLSRRHGEAVSFANSGGATALGCRGNRGGPLQPNQWKRAAKGGVLYRGEQRESRGKQ